MKWRGVLFDLFGTVVRPFPRVGHQRALSSAALTTGLNPSKCNALWEADYSNRVIGRSGAIGDVSTLQRLEELRVPVGLVSNAAPDFVTAFGESPLWSLFRGCVFVCAVGVAKPDREIYLQGATALNLDPKDLLFVGDGSDDELNGAAAAGLTAVLVEVDTADAYDSDRPLWAGARVRSLTEVLNVLGS